MVKKIRKWVGKAKLRLYMLSLSLYGAVSNASMVMAKGTKTKEGTKTATEAALSADKINNVIYKIVEWAQAFVVALGVAALVYYVFIPLITGGEKGKEKAKSNLWGVALGVAGVVLAVSIGNMYKDWLNS